MSACEQAGTYKPYFDAIIDSLSSLMEMRDDAQEHYEKLGGHPVVKHTNKFGATNIVKNPALVVIMECNSQALSYWRDLGLTPSGYKKLNADAVLKAQTSGFEQLLDKLMWDEDTNK